MRKIAFLLCLIVGCSAQLLSQDNYLITQEGKKIVCYQNLIMIDATSVGYTNRKGDIKYIKQKKLAFMDVNGRKFLNLPVRGNSTFRMQEVLAYSDDYMLTQYWQNDQQYLYVFDWNKELVMEQTRVLHKEKNRKVLLDMIKNHFGDCESLISQLTERLDITYDDEKQIYWTSGISFIKCGDKAFPY